MTTVLVATSLTFASVSRVVSKTAWSAVCFLPSRRDDPVAPHFRVVAGPVQEDHDVRVQLAQRCRRTSQPGPTRTSAAVSAETWRC